VVKMFSKFTLPNHAGIRESKRGSNRSQIKVLV